MEKVRPKGRKRSAWRFLLPVVVLGALLVAYLVVWGGASRPLIVYCAHDSVYSGDVLRGFARRTGTSVSVKFDTEATKSLGLVELLKREKQRPRCDVFWNNELLGTLDLQGEGVLEPYRGPGWERMPDRFKEPGGHWTGFGARLRVWIVNTETMQASQEAVRQVLAGDLSRVAIAKPLYGTTLTHYTVLWHLWGGPRLKAWHTDWRRRGVREVMGNAQVKNLVAEGVCDMGLTDTDDYFLAHDDGAPVDAVPVRVGDGSTICIPNTVCIIKGTNRREKARELVDYLLSRDCELALANSKSRQVPLGSVELGQLPPEVRRLQQWAAEGIPLASLGPARTACLEWLKQEYLR